MAMPSVSKLIGIGRILSKHQVVVSKPMLLAQLDLNQRFVYTWPFITSTAAENLEFMARAEPRVTQPFDNL